MGGAGKKLRQWAGYEYGRAVGNLPGNCAQCRKAHRTLKKRPPCDQLEADDPRQCPKYRLYPGETYGLHPKNLLAVQLYGLAAQDQRIGMDGYLIGTLDTNAALGVIELYSNHLPSLLSRQRTFELMRLLDTIATENRAAWEARLREQNRTKQ